MFDWINDVPEVVWGAFITGMFLTGQQVLNNAREDRRRKEDAAEREKDRLHQREESQDERKHQAELAASEGAARVEELQLTQAHQASLREADTLAARSDLWRDERREAHLALIPIFEEALRRLDTAFNGLKKNDEGEVIRPDTAVNTLNNDFRNELTTALAKVQIIGSKLSRDAANGCRAAMSSVDVNLWLATVPHVERKMKYAPLKSGHTKCKEKLEKYVDAVRIDLGTAD